MNGNEQEKKTARPQRTTRSASFCVAFIILFFRGLWYNRDDLTIRIRDNCREFDPRKRLAMFEPEQPEKNIGLRIVAGLAKQMDYYNTAGVNTLLIKL